MYTERVTFVTFSPVTHVDMYLQCPVAVHDQGRKNKRVHVYNVYDTRAVRYRHSILTALHLIRTRTRTVVVPFLENSC